MALQQLRAICRGYLVFIGLFGFLFGQAFFANFDLPATVAGLCGIFTAVIAGDRNYNSGQNVKYVLINGSLCLFGVTLDALGYYMSNPSAGNYYAWFLIGPYIVAVAFLMQQFAFRSSGIESSNDGS